MSQGLRPSNETLSGAPSLPPEKVVDTSSRPVLLVPYPKIVFLYPSFLVSLAAAIYLSVARFSLDAPPRVVVLTAIIFLVTFGINLVILAFDFPRTTSLTLFFFALALGLGAVLLFILKPELWPQLTAFLSRFRPMANAHFFWTVTATLALLFVIVLLSTRFDYWEVRPNELLHHHGFLSNLERFAAPNLRIDKEINDIFEYFLLRSGRLILHPSNERRAIILDNVPFIKRKEEAITRMLGALQVQVREAGQDS